MIFVDKSSGLNILKIIAVKTIKQGVVAHVFILSTWEAETGVSLEFQAS